MALQEASEVWCISKPHRYGMGGVPWVPGLLMLICGLQAYMVHLFEDAYLCSIHAKRVTLFGEFFLPQPLVCSSFHVLSFVSRHILLFLPS